MSLKELTAYAFLGNQYQKLQQERMEKMKAVIKTLSDDEYEQLVQYSQDMNDKEMIELLPKIREMVKDDSKKR